MTEGKVKSYKVHVNEKWLMEILNGTKTIEGRLNKGQYAEMIAYDLITFMNSDDTIKVNCKIEKIVKYGSFKEYLNTEDLSKCLPGISCVEDGINEYYRFYTQQDEQKYGVIAIHFVNLV